MKTKTSLNNTKVSSILSTRTGNAVPNQFEIRSGGNTYFQSYETIIAVYTPEGLKLDKDCLNYSVTTSKYLYQFTNMKRHAVERFMTDNPDRVVDLNDRTDY